MKEDLWDIQKKKDDASVDIHDPRFPTVTGRFLTTTVKFVTSNNKIHDK